MTGGLHLGNRNPGRAEAAPDWRFPENANPETANQGEASSSQLPTQLPPPPPKYPPPPKSPPPPPPPENKNERYKIKNISIQKVTPEPTSPSPKEQFKSEILKILENCQKVVVLFDNTYGSSLHELFDSPAVQELKNLTVIELDYPKSGQRKPASITILPKVEVDEDNVQKLLDAVTDQTFKPYTYDHVSICFIKKNKKLWLDLKQSSCPSEKTSSIQFSSTGRTTVRKIKNTLTTTAKQTRHDTASSARW
ncbi:hypothetical protein CL648_04655 [bacterium]|nr:hypothetical protein [bacterium]